MTTATAKPAPVTPTATPASAPPIPRLHDSAKYREGLANLNRLRLEVLRLEKIRDEVEAGRLQAARSQASEVEEVLRGRSAADVRRSATLDDQKYSLLVKDLRLSRLAVEAAEREMVYIERDVKAEAAAPFAPHLRAKTRTAALAWLAYIRAAGELDRLTEDLGALHGHGGCDRNALPRLALGDPTRLDCHSATIIRELIAAGILDEREDAELLRGLAVAPKPRPYTPPPPPAPKKKEPGSFAKALRRLGVSMGSDW
jgi:hypothetical protein